LTWFETGKHRVESARRAASAAGDAGFAVNAAGFAFFARNCQDRADFGAHAAAFAGFFVNQVRPVHNNDAARTHHGAVFIKGVKIQGQIE
jgi:hypothetical protein